MLYWYSPTMNDKPYLLLKFYPNWDGCECLCEESKEESYMKRKTITELLWERRNKSASSKNADITKVLVEKQRSG